MKFRNVLTVFAAAIMTCGGVSGSAADAPKKSSKVLIAFFSYSGNTRAAAGQIRKKVGGDLFEIKPQKHYPTSYNACVALAKKEIKEGYTPALEGTIDLAGYDVIFLGSPNWWGTMAPPVLSFIKKNDLSGKIIIPFFTHGGGGVQNCEKEMRKCCEVAGTGKVLPAGVFAGNLFSAPVPELEQWAEKSLKEALVKKK